MLPRFLIFRWPAVLRWLAVVVSVGTLATPLHGEWPMLRGNPRHDGFAAVNMAPAYHRVWAVEFENERLGTAMEPIVARGSVYVTTHAGSLHALDARSGEPRWHVAAPAPFLHSPAVAGNTVVAASADGSVYGVDADSGAVRWNSYLGIGGVAAAPVAEAGTVFIGSRTGIFAAFEVGTGRECWRCDLDAPIRQTAAVARERVVVTTEEPRCVALDTRTGEVIWKSELLAGQTARDYYPVIVGSGDRTVVIVRTNPAYPMATRIAQDRGLLVRNAGADGRDWKVLDAWLKSDAAHGDPVRWEAEQRVVAGFLATNRDARSCFTFDFATGRETGEPALLWAAGCQGVGAPPALTADGRLLVFHRSAYGNWNHGVAPLVTLSLFDALDGRLTPLFHDRGLQPPWNTFWGTADESQNFVVAGDTVLITHQGTLSGFDLRSSNLFTIHGERDTFGGLRNPPWARNEWHGPGRGGVALSEGRIYWLTGSRVLCLAPGRRAEGPPVRRIRRADVPTVVAPDPPEVSATQLAAELTRQVSEILSAQWAPLRVEPGLAGREFFFASTASAFEALAWAFPHLPMNERETTRAVLASDFAKYPPFSSAGALSLAEGRRREFAPPPPDSLKHDGPDKPPHPFAGVYAAWLYGQRCGEQTRVLAQYPAISDSFAAFAGTRWRLDGAKGDLHANRYLRALLAMEQLARAVGDPTSARLAGQLARENLDELARWWQRVAAEGTLGTFNTTAELDPFIGRGDGLSFRLAPHRHKVALFDSLSPELATQVGERVPMEVGQVWRTFEQIYATWWIVGEERQVHFGENYLDPPDLAAGAFAAWTWLLKPVPNEMRAKVDLPFCRADLFFVQKLGMALDILQRRGTASASPVSNQPTVRMDAD